MLFYNLSFFGPLQLEGEATARAIRLASFVNTPLYVVHVMSIDAMEEIAKARKSGLFYFNYIYIYVYLNRIFTLPVCCIKFTPPWSKISCFLSNNLIFH